MTQRPRFALLAALALLVLGAATAPPTRAGMITQEKVVVTEVEGEYTPSTNPNVVLPIPPDIGANTFYLLQGKFTNSKPPSPLLLGFSLTDFGLMLGEPGMPATVFDKNDMMNQSPELKITNNDPMDLMEATFQLSNPSAVEIGVFGPNTGKLTIKAQFLGE